MTDINKINTPATAISFITKTAIKVLRVITCTDPFVINNLMDDIDTDKDKDIDLDTDPDLDNDLDLDIDLDIDTDIDLDIDIDSIIDDVTA